jgi:hypothetical protein
MKKGVLAVIFLSLFFVFATPKVYAAETPGDGGDSSPTTPTSAADAPNLTEDGEDASKISIFDGTYIIAKFATKQALPGSVIYGQLYQINNNAATKLNAIAYDLWGTLGSHPGKTVSELLNEPTTYSLSSMGIVGMTYVSAYNTMYNVPSQNIAGYYANMLLPNEITDKNQSTLYAADCTKGVPQKIDKDNWGALTLAPACKSASDYWNDFGITDLWSMSFTFAMMIVVIVIVYVGYAVMFRVAGQSSVTIITALQNVIVGVALALMSFGLGAFFVNLSKFLTVIIADLFERQLWVNMDPTLITGQWLKFTAETKSTYISSPLAIFSKFIFVSLFGDYLVGTSNQGLLQGILPAAASDFTTPGSGGVATQLWFYDHLRHAQYWLKTPLYIITRIIAAGMLFWYSVRIWWESLKVFLFMLADTIFAPITFIMGAIPGVWKGRNIGDWFKRMFANSLKVPGMFAVVNLAGYIVISMAVSSASNQDPLNVIGGGYYGAMGTGGIDITETITKIIGYLASGVGPNFIAMLVLLSFAPKVPALIDEMFQSSPSGVVGEGLRGFNSMILSKATALNQGRDEYYKKAVKADPGIEKIYRPDKKFAAQVRGMVSSTVEQSKSNLWGPLGGKK